MSRTFTDEELDALERRLANSYPSRCVAADAIAFLRAERDTIRTALLHYGEHDRDCEMMTGRGPCSCGFQRFARAAMTESKT